MAASDAISFADLADSHQFAGLLSVMWNLAGIVVGLVEPSGRDSRTPFSPEMMCPVCQVIRSTPGGLAACRRDGLRHAEEALARQGPECYVCHAGLMDFVVPVIVEGRHVATIEGGQVLLEPPSEEGLAEILRRTREHGIDEEELRRAYFGTSHISRDKLVAAVDLVSLFARHCSETAWRLRRAEGPPVRPEVAIAMDYIVAHCGEQISLSDAAARAHLSPAYFSSVFSRCAGMTFTSFVQRTRIERAKKLLRETERTITDIAFDVGFNNLTHFNHVFRKWEGTTPSAFRGPRPPRDASA